MDWTLILIGNLVMDSTIAIYAILVSIESHYLHISDEKYRLREMVEKAGELYNKQFENNPIMKSILEDGDEANKQLKKSIRSFWDYSDKCLFDADKYYNKAKSFSLFKFSRIIIIAIFFIIGIMLQIKGIFL